MSIKKYLEMHLPRMQKCFNLTHFEVSLKREKSLKGAMEILIDYEYLQAVIYYGKNIDYLWAENRKRDILITLCHELTHIITGEIKTTEDKPAHRFKDERATEHISRLLYKLYIETYT